MDSCDFGWVKDDSFKSLQTKTMPHDQHFCTIFCSIDNSACVQMVNHILQCHAGCFNQITVSPDREEQEFNEDSNGDTDT